MAKDKQGQLDCCSINQGSVIVWVYTKKENKMSFLHISLPE